MLFRGRGAISALDPVNRRLHIRPLLFITVFLFLPLSLSPPFAVQSLDLTGDVDEIVNFLDSVQKTNGQDAAECYELALREARNLSWREDKAKVCPSPLS